MYTLYKVIVKYHWPWLDGKQQLVATQYVKALHFCTFIATGYNIVKGGLQMKLSMSTGWYYYITLKNSKINYYVQRT